MLLFDHFEIHGKRLVKLLKLPKLIRCFPVTLEKPCQTVFTLATITVTTERCLSLQMSSLPSKCISNFLNFHKLSYFGIYALLQRGNLSVPNQAFIN